MERELFLAVSLLEEGRRKYEGTRTSELYIRECVYSRVEELTQQRKV
jgi:hypothetical protein